MTTTMPGISLRGCFRTPVIAGILFSERVNMGRYDDVFVEVIDDMTHLEQPSVSRDVEFELFPQSNLYPVGDERRTALEFGVRPATFCELLAFGAAHPDVQRQVPVVAADLLLWSVPYTAILGCEKGRRTFRVGQDLLTRDALVLGIRVLQRAAPRH